MTVKTTLDIKDELLVSAKKLAESTGHTRRSVVEEGLRRVLSNRLNLPCFVLDDCSVGTTGGVDPRESLSWQHLRKEIYGEPVRR